MPWLVALPAGTLITLWGEMADTYRSLQLPIPQYHSPEAPPRPSPAVHAFFVERVNGLLASQPVHVEVYLDERGTAATDRLFITGGIAVYADHPQVARAWQTFMQGRGGTSRKGKSFKKTDLYAVADFLLRHPILPVATW